MRFKNKEVLNNVNIKLEKGKIYGFIGRNGCGKTVLFKIICGLLTPTSGEVYFDNKKIGKDIDFPEDITVEINPEEEELPEVTHTCAFGTEWKKDATDHWLECECGETSEKAAHTWDEGEVTVEPTEEAEGKKVYTCSVCGQKPCICGNNIEISEPVDPSIPIDTDLEVELGVLNPDGTAFTGGM